MLFTAPVTRPRRSAAVGIAVACLAAVVSARGGSARGQDAVRQRPAGARGAAGVTDVIEVAGGGEIRGAVVTKLPDGSIDVAVQRTWLEGRAPEAAATLVAEERRQTRVVMESLARRIAAAIAELPESRTRTLALLRREADRIDAWLAADDARADRDGDPAAPEGRRAVAGRDESQFALLRIARKRIVRVRSSGQAAQRVARWAWSERLADVEDRSAADLRKELEARGIDPVSAPPPLGDRLPPLPQDDREWTARMALVEDALGDPMTFQGFGDRVVKSGETEGGFAGIVPQLMRLIGPAAGGDGLGEILQGLGNGGFPGVPRAPRGGQGPDDARWLAAAREQSAAAGRFRATRVTIDAPDGRAEVESVFQARMPDGSWETIWRDVEAADANRADEAAVERITADERIASLLQAIRGIGIVDEAAIMQAIRVGAATMSAQNAVDSRFADFRSRHVRRLDSPPLRWDGR